MTDHTTETWRDLLEELLSKGKEVAPTSLGGDWRGRTTREIVACRSTVPMAQPLLLCPGRKLGYRFAVAEAAWILSGDNRLATIRPYAKQLTSLSGDGRTLMDAYGPPFVDQVPYVYNCFKQDPATRQAVITTWRPRPASGTAVPCTLTLQFLVRSAMMDCVVGMRSSDVWMGLPYDWFAFSMMAAFTALALRPVIGSVGLGDLTVFAGSQHIYRIDWDVAAECVTRSNDDLVGQPQPLNLDEFKDPDDLIEHLWRLARKEPIERSFLNGFIS